LKYKNDYKDEINAVTEFVKTQGDKKEQAFIKIIEKLSAVGNGAKLKKEEEFFEAVRVLSILDDEVVLYIILASWSKVFKEKKDDSDWLPERAVRIVNEGLIKHLNTILPKKLSVLCFPYMPKLLGYLASNLDINDIITFAGNDFNHELAESLYEYLGVNNFNCINQQPFLSKFGDEKFDLSFINLVKEKTKNITAKDSFSKKELQEFKDFEGGLDTITASILKTLVSLKENGISICLVKNGFLTNRKYEKMRDYIKNNYRVLSIIEMPTKYMFKKLAAKTSLLIIKNSKDIENENVFLAKFEDKNIKEQIEKLSNDFEAFIKGEFNHD